MSADSKLNEYFAQAKTDGELLPVVDEQDRVVRLATRREIHTEGLLHRAVHVVLHDGMGRVLLQQRSASKDHLPGWWDVSVGGHVGPGEDYDEAAVREIEEEMGIVGAEPLWIARQEPSELTGWEFIHVFMFQAAGVVRPDPDEISNIAWVTGGEYHERMASDDNEWRMSPAGDRSIRLFFETGLGFFP
jgi:isopentenyl-diphosphate delta-isomerase type 1